MTPEVASMNNAMPELRSGPSQLPKGLGVPEDRDKDLGITVGFSQLLDDMQMSLLQLLTFLATF